MGSGRQTITLNFTDSMRYTLIFWKGFKQQSMINIQDWKMYLNRTDKMFRLGSNSCRNYLRENENFFKLRWGSSYVGFKLPWVKLQYKNAMKKNLGKLILVRVSKSSSFGESTVNFTWNSVANNFVVHLVLSSVQGLNKHCVINRSTSWHHHHSQPAAKERNSNRSKKSLGWSL